MVGNKSDLEQNREVSREKAEQFCNEFGMEMLETSAKSGQNVLQAFEKLIGIVHNRALAAAKNKGGIKGMENAVTDNSVIKLDDKEGDKAASSSVSSTCGC